MPVVQAISVGCSVAAVMGILCQCGSVKAQLLRSTELCLPFAVEVGTVCLQEKRFGAV